MDYVIGNGLTDAEEERLHKLVADLGDAQKIIGKILLHGYESTPLFEHFNNREILTQKIAFLHCTLGLLISSGDINNARVQKYVEDKMKTFFHWLSYHPNVALDIVSNKEREQDENWGPNVFKLVRKDEKENG